MKAMIVKSKNSGNMKKAIDLAFWANQHGPLSREHIVQALRDMVVAEYDAVQLYERFAMMITDEATKSTILDITEEEKVHIGEFVRLIEALSPEEIKSYLEGEDEATDKIGKFADMDSGDVGDMFKAVPKSTYEHPDKLGEGVKKRKGLKKKDKFQAVMGEFKRGNLRSGSGEHVGDRKQAIAIAYSESGMAKSESKMSRPVDEAKWKRAVEIAEKQGHAEEYDYIMGIYKKMVGVHSGLQKSKYISRKRVGDKWVYKYKVSNPREQSVNIERDFNKTKSYAESIFGKENVSTKYSGLSGSSYIFIDNGDSDIKIRISDHDLPETYHAVHGTPDFDITPGGSLRGDSNGYWDEAVAYMAKVKGIPVPSKISESIKNRKEKELEEKEFSDRAEAEYHKKESERIGEKEELYNWAMKQDGSAKEIADQITVLKKQFDESLGDKKRKKKIREKLNNKIEALRSTRVGKSIAGGKSSGMTMEDIAKKHGVPMAVIKKQMDLGMEVEREHSSDPKIIHRIAMDHLSENPHYYTKLNSSGLADELKKSISEESKKKVYSFLGKKIGFVSDGEVHNLADSLGEEKDDVEEFIYSIATGAIRRDGKYGKKLRAMYQRQGRNPDGSLKKSASWDHRYKLQGKRKWNGLDISIENRKGSVRRGTDPDGKPWSQKMKYAYGRIRGTEGNDGEHADVYMGPKMNSGRVFVVHQNNPWTGRYDEDKTMLGFDSPESAKRAYLSQYNRPDFFGSMTEFTVDEFKDALKKCKGKRLEKAIKKDLDYFKKKLIDALKGNSGEVSKSIYILSSRMEKAKTYAVGTIREWKGRKFIKAPDNTWKRYYDKGDSRGFDSAVKNVMKKIQGASSMDELIQIVKNNRSRFTDPDGHALPIIKELIATSRESQGGMAEKKANAVQQTANSVFSLPDSVVDKYKPPGQNTREFLTAVSRWVKQAKYSGSGESILRAYSGRRISEKKKGKVSDTTTETGGSGKSDLENKRDEINKLKKLKFDGVTMKRSDYLEKIASRGIDSIEKKRGNEDVRRIHGIDNRVFEVTAQDEKYINDYLDAKKSGKDIPWEKKESFDKKMSQGKAMNSDLKKNGMHTWRNIISSFYQETKDSESRRGVMINKEMMKNGVLTDGRVMVIDKDFSDDLYGEIKKRGISKDSGYDIPDQMPGISTPYQKVIDSAERRMSSFEVKPGDFYRKGPVTGIEMKRESGSSVLVDSSYYDLFNSRYGDKAKFYPNESDDHGAITVRVGGKTVGVVMPLSLGIEDAEKVSGVKKSILAKIKG